MKKSLIILFVLNFISGINLFSQTDIEQINNTIMKYIEGTAIGDPDKLREAFHEDFNLYLVEDEKLKMIDGDNYIKRVVKGKKYNRNGRIISIDYENNAASAKIEVYFPDRNKIATDYLLLLKIKGQWKIIHKIINLIDYHNVKDLVSNENIGIIEIKNTLSDYINGTANGEPEMLKKAFHKDSNLYYIKNDSLSIIPGAKYIDYFKEGKKNNRIGHILSLDFENDAGLGKIEVIMPDRNRIAIDYLLLLKVMGQWKIIHKSFTSKSYDN